MDRRSLMDQEVDFIWWPTFLFFFGLVLVLDFISWLKDHWLKAGIAATTVTLAVILGQWRWWIISIGFIIELMILLIPCEIVVFKIVTGRGLLGTGYEDDDLPVMGYKFGGPYQPPCK